MENSRRQGRLVGVFVIVQLVLLIVPYVMLAPGVTADYVTAAAEMSATIKTAVFLLFGTGAVTLAIAITAYPAFRERSLQWSLWLVAISIVWFVMQCVDNAYVMSMVSLSRRFAENTGANSGLYDLIAAQTRSSRMWVHYTELLGYDIWFTSFYGILLRYTLVPRLISLIGLLAVLLHLVAIPLPMFFDYPGTPLLVASLAVSHVLAGGWLIARDFSEGRVK